MTNIIMTLSRGFFPSRAASNPVVFAQLNGSLVLLDLCEGLDTDPSAVQELGYVLGSCKGVIIFLPALKHLDFGVWRAKPRHIVMEQDGNNSH